MVTYTVFADVDEREFQNTQELATVWADVESDISRFDGELESAYAVLGSYDFQFTYRVDDPESAMKIAFAIERHGLDTTTHQVAEVDRLGDLVEDI